MIRHSLPTLGNEESEAVSRVILSGNIAQGKEVEAFEREVAESVGRRYGVAVSSGTAALHLSLKALGVTQGTPVALPAYACASLMTAVNLQGGVSQLLDIDTNFAMQIQQIPDTTDSSIAPHLFGAVAPIPQRGEVIEDIAQSIGGTTGCASRIAIASFYATKMMTCGEGGMVLTDDESIAECVRDSRDYDNRDTFAHRHAYKMTDMQAAMGRVQLAKLPQFVHRRREIAHRYTEAFAELPVELPQGDDHVYFRYVVKTPERASLEEFLMKRDIESKRPVYRPAHNYFLENDVDNRVELRESYPGADAAHDKGLSLPIYPSLSDNAVSQVIKHTLHFFEQRN